MVVVLTRVKMMTGPEANKQLKELEQARDKLSKQIESSQLALKEIDKKIALVKKELSEANSQTDSD
jgi:predicted  nucleic acid-binding Zn-ribbon protein